MLAYCSQVSVSWRTISYQTAKRNCVKHRQIWQGNCVDDSNNYMFLPKVLFIGFLSVLSEDIIPKIFDNSGQLSWGLR